MQGISSRSSGNKAPNEGGKNTFPHVCPSLRSECISTWPAEKDSRELCNTEADSSVLLKPVPIIEPKQLPHNDRSLQGSTQKEVTTDESALKGWSKTNQLS
eukprot:1780949-Amphidinium_carterae.1